MTVFSLSLVSLPFCSFFSFHVFRFFDEQPKNRKNKSTHLAFYSLIVLLACDAHFSR